MIIKYEGLLTSFVWGWVGLLTSFVSLHTTQETIAIRERAQTCLFPPIAVKSLNASIPCFDNNRRRPTLR